MCGIDRTQFEKSKKNFIKHCESEHNMWNYVYFIIYIKNKHLKDCNGIEYYLKRTFEKGGLEWSPNGCCMALDIKEKEKNVDMAEKMEEILEELKKNRNTEEILLELKKCIEEKLDTQIKSK